MSKAPSSTGHGPTPDDVAAGQDLPRLMSVARAAEVLDCSRGHIYGLIAAGKLRAVETRATGRKPKTRIYESDLAEFIEANTRTAPKAGER